MLMVANIQGYLSCCLIVLGVCLETLAMEQSVSPKAESRAQGGLALVSLARTPMPRIESGGVFALRALIRNHSDKPAVGELVGKLVGQTGEEHRRQIGLGAWEEKAFDLQIRISRNLTNPTVTAVVNLNAIENGREILLQKGDEPISQTLTLPVDVEHLATVIVLELDPPSAPYWRWPQKDSSAPYELVLATRVDAGFSRRCINLDSEPIPLTALDWQGVDSLVIGNAETLKNASVLTTLKLFLQRGGCVLVLLEEVDTKLVRDLLTDGQQCETVDTVELNHFVMDVRSSISFSLEDRTTDRDEPTRMKRVLQQGGKVTHSIDGWPAAISMKVGEGVLILTTLESSAWLKLRTFHRSDDPLYRADYTVPLWAATLTSGLMSELRPEPLEAIETTYPLELIGTPVLSRKWVGVALIGFCVFLASIGTWIAFLGDLKSIGLLAPLLALAASIPLFVAAMWSRNDIPSMSTELQIVQFWPDGGGRVRSKAAVYLPASRSMALVGESEGFAIPSENLESGIRRFSTNDFQKWEMSNTDWPPGTWRYNTEVALNRESFSAPANLTSKGLEIELPQGLPSPPEDVVVNFTPGSPCLGNLTDQNRRLLVDGEWTAEGNRWTSASMVSDEQGRRAVLYSQLFSPSDLRRILPSRTLYFWTKLWPQAPTWNFNLERRGAALVSVPIQLATPEVGSQVLIPHSLVHIEPQSENTGVSAMYNYRTGRWGDDMALEMKANLSFVLPPEVVPLEATEIQVDWDIVAPKRKVKLVWSADASPVELVALDSPSIPWRGTIDDPRVLKDLTDGRLDLRIEVVNSEGFSSESQDNFISWRIKHLRLSVSGRTLPRNNLAFPNQK